MVELVIAELRPHVRHTCCDPLSHSTLELVAAESPFCKQQPCRDRIDTSDSLCSLRSRASAEVLQQPTLAEGRVQIGHTVVDFPLQSVDRSLSLGQCQTQVPRVLGEFEDVEHRLLRRLEVMKSKSQESFEGDDKGLSLCEVRSETSAATSAAAVESTSPSAASTSADAGRGRSNEGLLMPERPRSWTFDIDEYDPFSGPLQAGENWTLDRPRCWTAQDEEQLDCDFEEYSSSLSYALSPGASPMIRPRTSLPDVAYPVLDVADDLGARRPSMTQVPELTTVEQWEACSGPLPPSMPCARPLQAPKAFASGFGTPDADSRSLTTGSAPGSSTGSAAGDESWQAEPGPAEHWPSSGSVGCSPEGGYKPMSLGSSEWPTLGSMAHYYGTCRPCGFMAKGCSNGMHCPFCHLCDAREKIRRQKTKAALYRHLHRQRKDMKKASRVRDQ